jgi:hypothetical protein
MNSLKTDRLKIRRFLIGDLKNLFAIYSDPEVQFYFPEGRLTYDEFRVASSDKWVSKTKSTVDNSPSSDKVASAAKSLSL